MRKRVAILGVLLVAVTCCLLSLADNAIAQEQGFCDQNRWWDTIWWSPTGRNRSPLNLSCSGSSVRGYFANGIVTGNVGTDRNGHTTLSGRWNRTRSESGGACPYGNFYLVLSPDSWKFNGGWSYCNDSPLDPRLRNVRNWLWDGYGQVRQASPGGGAVIGGATPLRGCGSGPPCRLGYTCNGQRCVSSDLPQGPMCAAIGQHCVSGQGPSRQPLCCNVRGTDGNGPPSVCVWGTCTACIPHGEAVLDFSRNQVCCDPEDRAVLDTATGGAHCDLPAWPDKK